VIVTHLLLTPSTGKWYVERGEGSEEQSHKEEDREGRSGTGEGNRDP